MPTKHRLSVLLAGVTLVAGACSSEAAVETTVATTTTTLVTTSTGVSTTLPPMAIEGAPPELAAVVELFYDYAAAKTDRVPPAADAILATVVPSPRETPTSGVASVGLFAGQGVATAEFSGDLFLMVDDGSGWRVVGGNWPSLGTGPYYGPSPDLVAVLGSDARPWEDMATARADSIHVVGLDGVGGGGIVGIPRDSYVNLAGGGRGKINSALSSGGPEEMMQTLRDLSGLPLQGYVLTGFTGFQEMLGYVLGGIQMVLPYPIRDRAAGADLAAGDQYLNGPEALAFARARKSLPNGDFTRSEHQGMLLIEAARKVRAQGYGAIPRLLEMSEPWMLTDLSPEELLGFSALLIGSDLDHMANVVLPGRTGSAGSASVVYLADSAPAIWGDIADGRLGS